MKKVVIGIVIVVLCLAAVGASATAVYMFSQYNESQEKLNKLEAEIDEIKDKYKNKNASNSKDEKIDDEDFSDTEELVNIKDENSSSYKRLIEIDFDTLKDMISNKESFILLVSQTWCSHCQNYKPVLNKVLDDNRINIYVIELDLLDENEYEEAFTLLNISGTPTTLFFEDGKEKDTVRIYGESDETTIISALRARGYIK